MKIRVHVFIKGRVQGVFFRSTTAMEAMRRGVRGWIQNLPDGSVEAVFEGEKEGVDALIAFCAKGPPRARVQNVDTRLEEYVGEYNDFTIAY